MAHSGGRVPEIPLESLDSLRQNSQRLLNQARKSNIWQGKKTFQAIQTQSSRLDAMADQQNQQMAFTQNILKGLLDQFGQNMLNAKREREELEKQNRFLAAQVIYYPAHTPPSPSYVTYNPIIREALIAILDTPDVVLSDIEHIWRTRELIPAEHRSRAERLLAARQFQTWTLSPGSSELLIHGDFDGIHYVSGLSWFCCSILRALSDDSRFGNLAHLCGRHPDERDPIIGGTGLMRSLVSQLLRQYPVDLSHLEQDINLSLVKSNHADQLCNLFSWVLYRLPQDSVVFCLVDGIKYYERQEYLEDMSEVLRHLLDVRVDRRVKCVFKLPVTSPSSTRYVREAFEEECIISMTSIVRTGEHPSDVRVARCFEGHLNNEKPV
ncbi:hypothetical protein F4778DRAFT_71921 [Xylariomycetidae sp. FL2044]|nr:hypothetical protein F4778DRAFT_71921 [Xylariomycetidae sp. FL2044]